MNGKIKKESTEASGFMARKAYLARTGSMITYKLDKIFSDMMFGNMLVKPDNIKWPAQLDS